jgi:hypothetical protein
MHGLINVKSLNNTSKWQMGFNWAFKRLITLREKPGNILVHCIRQCSNMKSKARVDGVCVCVCVFYEDYAHISSKGSVVLLFSCLGLTHTAFPCFCSLRTELFWSWKLFSCFRSIMGTFKRERLDICFITNMTAAQKVLPKDKNVKRKTQKQIKLYSVKLSLRPSHKCIRESSSSSTYY